MSGIYVHIPFCAKKCSYCDFHFSTTFAAYRNRMIEALSDEIRLRAMGAALETIYFGGGTPSLLTPNELQFLLNTISESFDATVVKEITLECNPDDCSEEQLLAWKNLGINRLSIGLQSFTDAQLQWMNRTHSADEGLAAVQRAKNAGFNLLTVDLMYGLPDLSPESWKAQLQQVIDLEVEHVSAYCLTVEERTPLAKWVKSGTIHPSDADQQSQQFELLTELLGNAGFEQYEISNFARNRRYSLHNTAYWQGKTYVAIGPSAHGFDGTSRYWNVANNHEYMRLVEAGELPGETEELSVYDLFNEAVMVGLRTQWGVNKELLFSLLEPGKNWFQRVEHYISTGKMSDTGVALVLTKEGKLLADAIASDLFVLE